MYAPRADEARAAASRTTRSDTRLASQSNLAFFHAASAASAFAFASSNVRFSIVFEQHAADEAGDWPLGVS